MKKIVGGPAPRPVQSLKDMLKSGTEGGPMAPDVETVFSPLGRKKGSKKSRKV
jgi:hypothetical protein